MRLAWRRWSKSGTAITRGIDVEPPVQRNIPDTIIPLAAARNVSCPSPYMYGVVNVSGETIVGDRLLTERDTVGLAREKRIYVKCPHCGARFNILVSTFCPNCNAAYEGFINCGEVVYI